MNFKISPENLKLEKIGEILNKNIKLSLSTESVDLITHCRSYLDRKLENNTSPIYGITTGFGSLHNKTISHDQLNKLQENLVMSHACGTGPVVREDIVRLMLFLKIHALSLGKSGVQVMRVLVRLFTNRDHSELQVILLHWPTLFFRCWGWERLYIKVRDMKPALF
jgi:histidine ammonia-lyase